MATSVATRTDAEIQREVLDELEWDTRVQPNEIGVAVKGGVVTLTGWVDSFTKRWAAEEAESRVLPRRRARASVQPVGAPRRVRGDPGRDLGAGDEAELRPDAMQVVGDRADREDQRLPDLSIGQPARDQDRDVSLALGQRTPVGTGRPELLERAGQAVHTRDHHTPSVEPDPARPPYAN